jgi:hypothetical protein
MESIHENLLKYIEESDAEDDKSEKGKKNPGPRGFGGNYQSSICPSVCPSARPLILVCSMG